MDYPADMAVDHRRIPKTGKPIALLERILLPEEWAQFQHYGGLWIEGKWGDYLINLNGRRACYRNGELIGSACIFLTGYGEDSHGDYPEIDTLIALYLLFKNDELGFWKTACFNFTQDVKYRSRSELDRLEREVAAWRAADKSASVVAAS